MAPRRLPADARTPGQEVAVTLRRDGDERGVDVRLGEQPESATTTSTTPGP